jgi:predicted AAA+ superfamily ATPase
MPPAAYRRREIDDELDEYLVVEGVPIAVVLEGPRAVGKTSTAAQRATTRYDLDDEAQRAIVASDLDRAVAARPPVLIDEWQYYPPIWDRVRRAVDDHTQPGPFLLTGSAAPQDPGTHTGAGRMLTVRMRPLSLAERWPGNAIVSLRELLSGSSPEVDGVSRFGLGDYTEEIVGSGFPGIRRLPDRVRTAQLESYLSRVIDRDFAQLGHQPRNPAALRRWMQAYAAATSTTATWETIRDSATSGQAEKPARTTTLPYRDVLERLYLLDPLPGWRPTRSHLGRLTEPPKHHLADPALATALLGLTADRLLAGEQPGPVIPRQSPFLGALFESLVTLSMRVYAQAAQASVSHMRTYAGEHEIDLIVQRRDGRVLAIEVKLKSAPDEGDVRQLKWLKEQLGNDVLDTVLVTTGKHAYRRKDRVAVVPAALIGP